MTIPTGTRATGSVTGGLTMATTRTEGTNE